MKKIYLLLCFLPILTQAQIDYELEFTSTTQDYVEMTNVSTLIANSTTFSMSCWVNPQSNSDHGGIIGFRNNSDADFYLVQMQNTNNIEARFRNSSGVNYDILVNNILDFGQWQHLAFTYDGSYICLYKNGIIVDSTVANGTITQTTQSFRLGSLNYQGSEFYLIGRIDEVRLWDVALSSTEIDNWMCTGIDTTHPSYNNLIGYWRLNDCQQITAYDETSNGNDGTLINGVATYQNATSCFASSGSLTRTYVPDDNFEQALINLGYDNVLDDSVITANINCVFYLEVSSMNIFDLTGIEDFISLDTLICNNNQLDSLDLSINTSLTYLECWSNNLSYLDISQNSFLRSLYCEDNQLIDLNLSGTVNLKYFYCDNNQLTFLDVSNNVLLRWLQPQANQLVSLDISNLTVLSDMDCAYNNITSLDISNNTQLISLDCHDNDLISLDIRNGNNQNMDFNTQNNINLTCISVDDTTWASTNWTLANGNIDIQHYFSFDCSFIPSSWNCVNNACVDPGDGSGTFSDSLLCISSCIQTEIFDQINNPPGELIRIIDVLGKETQEDLRRRLLFYIYSDGTVEKQIIIE